MKNGIILRCIGVLIICYCAYSDNEEEPTSAFCCEVFIVNNNTFKNRIEDDGKEANFFAISNAAIKNDCFKINWTSGCPVQFSRLKKIDLYKVFTVLKANLMSMAGIWSDFDDE